jgi:hypothetical protein
MEIQIMNNFSTATLLITTVLLSACTTTGLLTSSRETLDRSDPSEVADLGMYALPRILHTVIVTFPACTVEQAKTLCPVPTLSLAETPLVIPDPKHMYRLTARMSQFSGATVVAETDGKHLLKSLSITAKDETGSVIGQLAELVKAGAKAATLSDVQRVSEMNFNLTSADAATGGAFPETIVTSTIDLGESAAETVDAFSEALAVPARRYGPKVLLKLVVSRPNMNSLAGLSNTPGIQRSCSVGVCYRPLLPYGLSLAVSGDTAATIAVAPGLVALLPNDAPIVSIDLHRTSLVERKGSLTFVSGVLTKVEITKPSEALAAATLPVTILNTLISIPAELLKLRIDLTTQQKSLVDMQSALTKAIKDASKATGS